MIRTARSGRPAATPAATDQVVTAARRCLCSGSTPGARPMEKLKIHGTLGDRFDVYHGPTADGPHQVHVILRTHDHAGEGRACSVVTIPEDTSLERIAMIIHEQALALLAHELLEGIGPEPGNPTIDPHAGGRMATMPDVDAPMFRRVADRLGLGGTATVSVLVPERLSHRGEAYRKQAQIDVGVAEIVRRLNHPIFGEEPITEQSCEGHGRWYPYVQLVGDETALIVPTKDVRRIEAVMNPPVIEPHTTGG